MKTNKKVVLIAMLAVFAVVVSEGFAAVTEPNIFRYREISPGGQISDTATPVTDVNVIGFVCSSANCASVSGALDLSNGNVLPVNNPPVMNSGSSDKLNIIYPTTLQSPFGYGLYFYKDGYIPYEGNATWNGTGTVDAWTNYLAKAKSCSAPIMNLTMLNNVYKNMPLIIDMDTTLDADTFAAIKSAGPLDYVPPKLLDKHYSVDTSVTLVIKNGNGDVVHTNTTNVLIPYSGSKHVRFTWTPTTEDTYTAFVTTGVPDAKCVQETVIPQTQSKVFNVWAKAPKNQCYTLINGLSYSTPYPKADEPLTFTFGKISNYANSYDLWDPNYNLAPVKTRVTYLITNSTGNVVLSQPSATVPENPNNSAPATFNFSWTPTNTGNYTAWVSGIADDVRCLTVSNPQETATTTLFVSENVADTTPPGINITSHTDGQTISAQNITVSGTASDDKSLDAVQVKVGNGTWENAAGTTSWSKAVSLALGSNTIYARANDTSGNAKEVSITVNSGTTASNTSNTTQKVDTAPQQAPTSSGSTGSSGGGYYPASTGNNKKASFSNVSIPDSINSGELLSISGCISKLNKNSTVDIYLDSVLKRSAAVNVSAPCFSYSEIIQNTGKHLVYLWFNESGTDFSKSVNVIAKENAVSTQAASNNDAKAKVIDISANESARAGVPVTLKVTVRALEPGEASLILFADNAEVGRKQATISGDAVFSFPYTFSTAGTKTLRAVVQTEGGEDSLLKKIEVKEGIPTGSFIAATLQNPGVIATVIGTILAGGYYAARKGYLSALKNYLSSLKWW